VAWVKRHGRGSQVKLANLAKVDPGTFSAYKKGRHGLGLSECRIVADHIGFPASELFVIRVPENLTGTSPVRPSDQQSASTTETGDVHAAIETRVLRDRNAHLEKENASLRAAIKAITRIVTHAAAGSASGASARPRSRR